MDSEDKKDLIRTIKSKSKEEEPEEDMGSEEEPDTDEEFSFDDEEVKESYDKFMDDTDDPFDGMDKYFSVNEYGSYMGEDFEDDPLTPKDETSLLFDNYDDDEINRINRYDRYSRSNSERARRLAQKDISKHYHKPAAPGYEEKPSEEWASYKLPYDTRFVWENRNINEDHFNDKMETYEQERAYEDIEKLVRRYGLDVEWCHKEETEDPEESLIYLDIVDTKGNELLKVRINSVGSIEVGEMKGKNFVGEPLDSVNDFIEIFGEDLTSKEKKDLNMEEDFEMMSQPQKAPEKQPNEPVVKPGTPEKRPGTDRPSRKPFSPPPNIDPNDPDSLPAPKARKPPAPPKPKTPVAPPKPGTDRPRPSTRPFTTPPNVDPNDPDSLPAPKAKGRNGRMSPLSDSEKRAMGYYDDDIEFS